MARSRRLLTVSSWGRFEQFARLVVADRRRLAFTAFGPRPLDAFDRVVGDGVLKGCPIAQRTA
jgi:hypothetical protein